jgi:hypothetical protein
VSESAEGNEGSRSAKKRSAKKAKPASAPPPPVVKPTPVKKKRRVVEPAPKSGPREAKTVEEMFAQRKTEIVAIKDLRPHPRNYRVHPEEQLKHIEESLRQHGFYRNVVIASDGTILAGHGLTLAAARIEGVTHVPVFRLDLDPEEPLALKVLAGDNELVRFAENDDRALTELLKEIHDLDETGLLGTGYDEAMLANLLLVTRTAEEIADVDAASEWVGMPEYEEGADPFKIIVTFLSEEDRAAFVEHAGLKIDKTVRTAAWSTRWPFTEREDGASVRFEDTEPVP